MRNSKKILVGLASISTSLCIFATSAPVASAAQPIVTAKTQCYSYSCERLNPANTVCADDAITILSRNAKVAGIGYGHHELRYSRRCHSNWTRFTPWHGLTAILGQLTANDTITGLPYVWRINSNGSYIQNSLRGPIGHSSLSGWAVTYWSSMVTANGRTCSSTEVFRTMRSSSGQGSRIKLGVYDAPCIS